MKTQHSQEFYGDGDYNLADRQTFPYVTIREGAKKLRIRQQRLVRHLRILQIPVHKIGTLVFLDSDALSRVKSALKNQEVKRGPKPNGSN